MSKEKGTSNTVFAILTVLILIILAIIYFKERETVVEEKVMTQEVIQESLPINIDDIDLDHPDSMQNDSDQLEKQLIE